MPKSKSREIPASGRVMIGVLIFIAVSAILTAVLTEALYSGKTGEARIPAVAAGVLFVSSLIGTTSSAIIKGEGRSAAPFTAVVIVLLRIAISLIGDCFASPENIVLIAATAAGCLPAIIAARRSKRVGRKRNWAK